MRSQRLPFVLLIPLLPKARRPSSLSAAARLPSASGFLRQVFLDLGGLIDVVLVIDVAILLQLVVAGGGHGIDIREDNGQEFLYLSYMFPVNVIQKTDLKGEEVWRKEKPPEPHVYDDPKARYSPTNIAFAPDGGFFVADGYGSNYIHRYDKDGKWVKTFGGTGDAKGKFKTPHGLWIDARPGREPMLVVADRANHRLQYLTLDGEPVSMDTANVSFPAHVETRGDIMMVPDLHARVSLFDKDNKVITHLGHDADWTKEVLDGFKVRVDPTRWKPGRFVHPHDACFDKAGNIIVAEWVVPGRLTFLRKVGA